MAKPEAVTLTVRIKPLIEIKIPALVSAKDVRSRFERRALRKNVPTRFESTFFFFAGLLGSLLFSKLFNYKLQ